LSIDFHIDIKHSDILVVDDNPINLKVLRAVLEKAGYSVRCAVNGHDTLQEIARLKPDLVLLDVQMPDIDGFEVCRRLKSSKVSEDIPVIFITATDTVEGQVEGFKSGGVDYISRPLQMPEVLARVRNQLMLRKLQQNSDAENNRLGKILGALPIAYMITSIEDGEILEINESACELLNISQEDATKYKSIDFYAEPIIRPTFIKELREKGVITNKELKLQNLQGDVFTAILSATALSLSGKEVLFVTLLDISERKKMELELESLATTDYLTGTLNRRAYTERANSERQRANRNKLPISMVFFDIDHFKKINDTYGHDVGDTALKTLVKVINECLRTTDILGRLGGEEFAVLLPETALEGAMILSDRIRQRVSEEVIHANETVSFSMTISGGLALWEEGTSYDDLFKVVDERLYAAKEGGRNRVIYSDD
jgi:two-component system, cell cycle response regulator